MKSSAAEREPPGWPDLALNTPSMMLSLTFAAVIPALSVVVFGIMLICIPLYKKVQNALGFGDHGSTYGGNPVCCAGAISILQRLDDAFLAQVRQKSEYVFQALADAPGVEAVTGMGLMIGIQTKKNAKDVVNACIEKGVLCLTAKTKVRLLPPLNIPMEQLKQAIEIIKDACK